MRSSEVTGWCQNGGWCWLYNVTGSTAQCTGQRAGIRLHTTTTISTTMTTTTTKTTTTASHGHQGTSRQQRETVRRLSLAHGFSIGYHILSGRPDRPHYRSCPSGRLLVCFLWPFKSKTKKCQKNKIIFIPFFHSAWVTGVPVFSSEGQSIALVVQCIIQIGGRLHSMSPLGRHVFCWLFRVPKSTPPGLHATVSYRPTDWLLYF